MVHLFHEQNPVQKAFTLLWSTRSHSKTCWSYSQVKLTQPSTPLVKAAFLKKRGKARIRSPIDRLSVQGSLHVTQASLPSLSDTESSKRLQCISTVQNTCHFYAWYDSLGTTALEFCPLETDSHGPMHVYSEESPTAFLEA